MSFLKQFCTRKGETYNGLYDPFFCSEDAKLLLEGVFYRVMPYNHLSLILKMYQISTVHIMMFVERMTL